MPLILPAMNVAIVCDDEELETYDVKQQGTSSLTAFVASEAGKQFKITFSNNLSTCAVAIFLQVDGRQVQSVYLRAGQSGEFLGPYKTECSILPLKFQELQLVDPDLEDAPVAPEMGTMELKAYRCQKRGPSESDRYGYEELHLGRISERSKKAGWHHVSTGDEVLALRQSRVQVEYLDPWTGPPFASIKIFYRPRELLRAQGIIPANDVGRQGSPINNKRVRDSEDVSPGPSRSRPKVKPVKGEELSDDTRTQRIQALQAELDALKDTERSSTSVKRELRSPSPIVVKHPGEVVDLTLED